MSFTVAIVGRPNVGKSTLFNRLTGKRSALVDDRPGVTRDRREGRASIGGLVFTVIDTAGLENAEKGSLQARMTAQSEEAIAQADVALLVIDARAGVTPMDEHFAKLLRRGKTPIVLVVNKAEGGKAGGAIGEAHRLGLGEPVAISAEHGEGLVDLHDALAPYDKETRAPDEEASEETGEGADEEDEREIPPLSIAIVGRPNAGKSTLLNNILGRERVLTGPEAGITRDAIAVEHEFEGRTLRLIDTAGMRRKANVTDKVEKLAVFDGLEAVRYAHVVVMLIDAQAPLEKQDNHIAAYAEQEGRAMVLAVNKWDMVDDKPAYLKAIEQRLEMVLPQVRGIPVVTLSGKTGYNVPKLLKACFGAYRVWNRKVGTGELNRWLEAALEAHTPPLVKGRRIKIRYMTQKTARPPTFLLFSNTSDIPDSYLRYLTAGLRERFALPGVPIRLIIRKSKNPYAGSKE